MRRRREEGGGDGGGCTDAHAGGGGEGGVTAGGGVGGGDCFNANSASFLDYVYIRTGGSKIISRYRSHVKQTISMRQFPIKVSGA